MLFCLFHEREVLERFKEFEAATTSTSGQRIGKLRTDNGGEFVSKEFEAYLKSKRIFHELSVPHSPELNGVAERMNCTLVESARSMLSHATVSVATAAYVRNRIPTAAIKEDRTPYKRWYGRKPNVSHHVCNKTYRIQTTHTEQELDTIIWMGVFCGDKTGFIRPGHVL